MMCFELCAWYFELALLTLQIKALRSKYKVPTLNQSLLFDHRNGAAGFFNLLARAFGKAMRRDFQRLGNIAVAEHHDVMLRFLDDAAMMHKFRRHFVVFRECFFQCRQADFNPPLLENIGKATFWQPAMQGHLTAFETDFHGIAGPRLLSFFAATGSLAQPRAGSASETLLPVGRTLCRMEIVETECHCLLPIIFHLSFIICHLNNGPWTPGWLKWPMINVKWKMGNDLSSSYSIIRIRCGTFSTAPRIDSVSGRSTI